MTDPIRDRARQVWADRYAVEAEAAVRFGALATRLREDGTPESIVEMVENAAQDELRHRGHCADIVKKLGGETLPPVGELIEYAPRSLSPRERLVYEVVAQSCIAETISMSTLVTLLDEMTDDALKDVIRELARDEVKHGQLGWAYLTYAQTRGDVTFLSAHLPGMLGANGEQVFGAATPSDDAPGLLRYGVLPKSMRRQLHLETLMTVVLPGFERAGIDTAAVRATLFRGADRSPAR